MRDGPAPARPPLKIGLPNLAPPPASSHRRICDGQSSGVLIHGERTRGRLAGCDIVGNKAAGVQISDGADPVVASCK